MHMDPIIPLLVGAVLVIFLIGLLLQWLKQPYVVAYLVAGVLLGPHGLALVTDSVILSRLGAFGVILLLFFVGMEISLPRLVANWRVAILGTLFQILISVICVWFIGIWLDWPIARVVLLGFVISLSSTAVVIKVLQEWHEVDTDVGQDVIGVLLVQDLAVIPMLITISFFGGKSTTPIEVALQIIGGIGIIGLLIWLTVRGKMKLPFGKLLRKNHEMQVFAALVLCLGLALLTGLSGLSAALGAFIGGIIVATARETDWVHKSLEPFHIVFVALFFVSIGMLVDLNFLQKYWKMITLLVIAAFFTNTFINAVILRFLGDNWRESLYASALLSQIGEFSFVLATVGLQNQLINQFGYETTIIVISLTLLLSPAWISFIKRVTVGKSERK